MSPQVRADIEAIVRRTLADRPIRSIDIRPAIDFDGVEYIHIDVHYDYSETQIDPRTATGLETDIVDIIYPVGEHRLPDVHNHFAKGQKIRVRRLERAP